MAVAINHVMLEKLLHDIQEIRVRTLHDIENKLKRALWENVEVCFNAASLFKNLIRWFGQNPICEEVTVLELMSLLLTSKYGADIVQYFTVERIAKELNKIRYLIGTTVEYDELVENLIKQVRNFKAVSSATAASDKIVTGVAYSLASLKLDTIDLTKPSHDRVEERITRSEDDPTFYTVCWEVPTPSVASVLQCFNDSLREATDADDPNLQHALSYLGPYIQDYPAEFFLQPPYIFLSLLRLVHDRKVPVRKAFTMLLQLVYSLEGRIREKKLTVMHMPTDNGGTTGETGNCPADIRKVQISVGAFVYELFQLGIELSKELATDLDMGSSNMIFAVLYRLTELLDEDDHFPVQRYVELRREMGYLIKHYRQEWESNTASVSARLRYLISLQVMLNVVDAGPKIENENLVHQTGAQPTYNPADYATMNSTGHRQALEETDSCWMNELHLARLDYPMQIACPELYTELWVEGFSEVNQTLCTLAGVREYLKPAVEMLRNGPGMDELTNAEILNRGLYAITTLHLHRSTDLVRVLMIAVGSCFMTEDEATREAMESVTLRLLAHGDEEIRCEAYDLCTGMMKEFVGQLDEGSIMTRRSLFSKTSPKLRSLGIPLSLEIVTEITCFGYPSSNTKIRRCAETMLLLLCNSRAFLREKWTDVQELLLPIAPLLQAATIGATDTTLRKAVMGLFHPDCELPLLNVLQGNLRMLFHEDGKVREEALTRVLFLLSSTGQAGRFVPRIEHISDTIPSGVCLLKMPYDIGKHQVSDVYEVSAVRPLLDTLEQEECDPGLRRSALVQLNAMAQDPLLCGLIHNASGWPMVLKALYNALQDDHQQRIDYPDAAIPAIGILTKLCFTVTSFRRFLGINETAYELIVRSLFAFHHMPVFRVECCALLYLLLFADYSFGAGRTISLPRLCQTGSFRLPFVCEFHWRFSPFREVSPLEELMVGRAPATADAREGESILRLESNTLEPLETNVGERQAVLQFIRFAFADLWFDGIDNMLAQLSSDRRTAQQEEHLAPIVYRSEGKETDNRLALRFDSVLRLTKQDVQLLKVTHISSRFRKNLRAIGAAKSHADVFSALATFEGNLLLPIPLKSYSSEQVIRALTRFVVAPPSTGTDQQLLSEVITLIGSLIELHNTRILDWVLELLANEANIFLLLLRSDDCSIDLYSSVINLLRIVLLMSDRSAEKKDHRQTCWTVELVRTVHQLLEAGLLKCELVRIIPLLELVRLLVEQLDRERIGAIDELIGKLLLYILHVRSTSYTGSTIVRMALLTIADLLEPLPTGVKMQWGTSSVKTVSTQCSHSSALVRACAWNVLAKIARTVDGASAIVRDCAYLPGGIHASCLSTLLDPHEACLVKESAAGLLISLLSHRDGKDGQLHASVQPVDSRATKPSATSIDPEDSLRMVCLLLRKSRFFEESVRSLEHFTARETLDVLGECDAVPLVTPELAKTYALIYRALVELVPTSFVPMVREKGCLQGLVDCVAKVPLKPTRNALLMVAEVCNLLVQCMGSANPNPVAELLTHNQAFIGGITYLLDPTVYEDFEDEDEGVEGGVLQCTTSAIMRLVSHVLITSDGNSLINCVLAHLDVKPIVWTIANGIRSGVKAYQVTCLEYMLMIALMSRFNPVVAPEFPSFMAILDSADMMRNDSPREHSIDSEDDSGEENIDPNRPRRDEGKVTPVDRPAPSEATMASNSGSGVIFTAILEQFETLSLREEAGRSFANAMDKRTLFPAVLMLLQYSPQCRRVAWERNLLAMIIDRFSTIHEEVLGKLSCPEFVRRYGEAKKRPIVEELSMQIGVLAYWFHAPADVAQLQPDHVAQLCRIVLQFWPWLSNNHDLELNFVRALAFLTEASIMVCKALVAPVTGFPHTILKLLIVTVTSETGRVKGPKHCLRLLKFALRVLGNCCSCHEGRSTIGKLNVIDNISKLHPSVTKLKDPWPEVTRLWLEFWAIYTCYSDISEVRHLTVLGALVRKSNPTLRLLSMSIVRNLTFVPANRSALLASADYMFILQSALQQSSHPEEQLVGAVAVWKLIANSHKGRAAVKGSPLVRMCGALWKHYALKDVARADSTGCRTTEELWNVLATVRRILEDA
ncbi:protein rotatin homolog [Anopheles cruzii]|uniref:protein rotatin homolog n=1 Tax=Anopheles cruzii TaxID=68878 RepID=UPI0022EC26C0|nr:protein rotatin homolog [Anopheles cruzii]